MLTKCKPSANQFCFIIVTVFTAAIFVLNSCHQKAKPNTAEQDIADGKILAQKYCVSCHQLPNPMLIDRESWIKGVLPAMSAQLHINRYMEQYFADKNSALNIVEWQKIVAYYSKSSPVDLSIPKPVVKPVIDWAIFSQMKPKVNANQESMAMTTLVTYNQNDSSFYTGDAASGFYRWDKNLNGKLLRKMPSGVTDAAFSKGGNKNEVAITCIGVLPPINVAKGKVITFNLDKDLKKQEGVTAGDSLPRAVQTVAADFNKDGLMDYVVCGFGHDEGGLYLLKQRPDHTFKKEVMRGIPGGEQLITGDFNNDGWTDVMCLFAQADEGLWMFLNDHKGGFETKNLMHFQPVMGSSSFQLVDFNHDGKPDILYTCGDNSDYSKVLKPYHGVYIFTNQGDWKFKQTYFYHIDGCTKAIAADFDHDGDLDIATIAFFPDFINHPSAGFTYLEQTKTNQFLPHELPIYETGRWLTMDIGDIDHDGNLDIMLGNFVTPGRGLINQKDFKPHWDEHMPVLVLKNNALKK